MNQESRPVACADVVVAIRELIIPFFEGFNDAEKCVAYLMRHEILWCSSVVEYALLTGGHISAQNAIRSFLEAKPKLIRSFLEAKPKLREAFEASRSEFIDKGLPKFRGGPVQDLAALVVAAEIDLV